ncbi:MAG: hypothetical protein IH984_01980 [Planctomycetes bacterium]|nr:hypothetical protein [Planctomycetota bacterium]
MMKNWHQNLVSCFAILLAIGISDAFGDPRSINGLVNSNSLNQAQQGQIEDYAKFYCNNLSSGDIDLVENAKRQLLGPLRAPSISPHFRLKYGKLLVPHLKPVIDGDSPYAAVNALQVVGFLGTNDALNLIKDHINIDDEESFAKRLWAVKAFVVAYKQQNLSANQLNPMLRQLGMACKTETQSMILHSQFSAISIVNSTIAREVLLDAVSTKLEDIAGKDNPSELMGAIYPALVSLRDQYLILPQNQQRTFGVSIAPSLCKVFKVSLAHWDKIQLDAEAKRQFTSNYKGANEVAEAFLRTIAREIGSKEPPQTQIADAWTDNDKPRFEAQHKIWHDIVNQPPYGR